MKTAQWLRVAGPMLAGLLMIAACGGGTKGQQTTAEVSGSTNVGDAALSYFVPASGPEFVAGGGFRTFENSVAAKSIGACMSDAGFTPPAPRPKGAPVSNVTFPDISRIRKDGFGSFTRTPDIPDPTNGMSTSQADAYNVALQGCQKDNLFEELHRKGQPLANAWGDVLAQIDASSEFQKALAEWRTCTEEAGSKVTTLNSFFRLVDSQVIPLVQAGRESEARSLERSLANTFVRCFSDAAALRDRARVKAKTAFLDDHAEEIRALQATAADLVARAEEEAGIEFDRVVDD